MLPYSKQGMVTTALKIISRELTILLIVFRSAPDLRRCDLPAGDIVSAGLF